MSHVTLVRHGQANTQARDEASYDRLSDLGHQQAQWLGGHFRQTGEVFARVYSGTLTRHIQTAAGIAADCPSPMVQDKRLNELEYFTMAQLLADQHGIPFPSGREAFAAHMPVLFRHWQDGALKGAPESFAAFEARVGEALHEIAAGEGRALVVTSGGLIGMAMRVVMGLDIPALCKACLAIENTSLHRFQPFTDGLILTQFNALPHLDSPERQHARSHL